MSLSFGPATAMEDSGAGALYPPWLSEGLGTTKEASHPPTEGSKHSVPSRPDLGLRMLSLRLVQ